MSIALNAKTLSKWFSDESLTKKAYLNALASALDYAARLAVGFIINPLLVAGLGNYGYGLWQVLGRLIGYISPASGRPTQALKWTIANQQASTDYDAKRRYVGSAIAAWLLFLPILAGLGGIVAWFAPVWFSVEAEFSYSVRLAAALLVVNLVMISLVDVPRAVLRGENLGYRRMGLSMLLVFAGGGFTVLALYLQTGLVGVAAATLASTLLTGALFALVARKYVPWFGIARPSWEALRHFVGLSGWFLLWRLVMQLMTASDVVLLGLIDSPEVVTVYTLTKYVPETLVSIVAIIVFGITPGLGGIIGSGKLQKAADVRSEIMLFTWLMAAVLGATILLWNQTFVTLWVGADYYAGPWPALTIILMMTQFVLIRNDATIIDLTLDLRNKVLLGLLSALLSVLLATLLTKYFNMGIVGICLGFIAGRFILSLSYPWLIGRVLGLSLPSQLFSTIRPIFALMLLFGIALGLNPLITVDSWLTFIMMAGTTCVMASIIALYVGLSTGQRQRLIQRVYRGVRPATADL